MVAAPASTIDATKQGSITINKFLNPDSYGEPTGNATDKATGTPLNGVTFTATRINGDITTNEGFAALAAMTPADAADNLSAEKFEGTTAGGTVTLEGLPLGAYLVTETPGDNVTDADGNKVTGLIPASPFIVFVPMTNPANPTEWNYNPTVNPKNTNLSTEKKVVDRNKNVGDRVDYTITSQIPSFDPAKETVESYAVSDRYDADELENMKVESVNLVTADGTEIPVEDFTFSDPAQLDDGRTEQKVVFGDAALKQFSENPGATVEVKLSATLKALGENGDGTVVNDALTSGAIGDGDGNTKPFETPESEVVTYLAKLQVNKANKEGAKLSGATFELYQSATCKAADLKDLKPLTVGGQNSWTTNGEGQIVIDGLHVTDFVDNAADTQDGYCLVETKAPEGYELLTSPIQLTFTKESMSQDGTFVPLHAEDVVNVPTTKVKLPATGGTGVALMLLIGAGIVGGGIYAARRNSTEA